MPWLCPGRQAVVISVCCAVPVFHTSHFTVPHFMPTEANFLALKAPEGRTLKANFPRVTPPPPEPLCGAGHNRTSTPFLGPRPSCPLESYGASLVPSTNKLLARATDSTRTLLWKGTYVGWPHLGEMCSAVSIIGLVPAWSCRRCWTASDAVVTPVAVVDSSSHGERAR